MSATFDSVVPTVRGNWRLALKQQSKALKRKVINSAVGKSSSRKSLPRSAKTQKSVPRGGDEVCEIEVNEKDKSKVKTTQLELYSALRIIKQGTYELSVYPEPEFENDEEIMIRNVATGLNPIDWKSVDYNFCLPSFPWITGREMAGIVHKVAPGVTRFKPGDRVWTSTYYKDVRAGCFQDLVIVPEHTVLSIPRGLTFEEAACLGVSGLTSAMTLWKWLQLPRNLEITKKADRKEKDYLLVWGGSTITGQFAIQLGILSGLEVIAVTSHKTRALAQSLGAYVITRDEKSNEEIVESIRKIGGEQITRGLDLVGNDTAPFSLQSLSSTKPCIFAPLAMMKSQSVPDHIKVVNVEMKQFVLDKSSRSYAEDLNTLVETGNIKLPQLEVLSGGLTAVEGGLKRLKGGDMGGKKMVVSWQ